MNFPVSFLVGPYKRYREDQLFDRETSYLPATQLAIEHDAVIAKAQGELARISAELEQLRNRRTQLALSIIVVDPAEFTVQWRTVDELYNAKYTEKRRARSALRALRLVDTRGQSAGAERRQVLRACPADGCKGFLNTRWTCGLCQTCVCEHCHEIVPASTDNSYSRNKSHSPNATEGTVTEHTCSKEALQTAKLLSKDTKPCPKCACLIHKIDGCDQMFCTMCHTAFSWRTTQVVTNGRIHNPHYYEWLRAQSATGDIPREPGDGPCMDGGAAPELPNYYQMRAIMRAFPNDPHVGTLMTCIREIEHIRQVEMVRYPAYRLVDLQSNMDIRKQYMLNVISKDKFKALLQRREKARLRSHEYHQIFSMFTAVASEHVIHLFNMLDSGGAQVDVQTCVADLVRIRQYTRRCLIKAARRFGAVPPLHHGVLEPL